MKTALIHVASTNLVRLAVLTIDVGVLMLLAGVLKYHASLKTLELTHHVLIQERWQKAPASTGGLRKMAIAEDDPSSDEEDVPIKKMMRLLRPLPSICRALGCPLTASFARRSMMVPRLGSSTMHGRTCVSAASER